MNVPLGLLAGAALSLLGHAACGGNVIVDPPGQGGAGGTTPAGPTGPTTGGGMGMGGAGPACPFPAPVGAVTECSGVATAGSGSPPQCDTFFCDNGGNQYTVQCSPTSCDCLHNGQTLCKCESQGTGDICAGTAEPCCPFPFAP